MAIVTITGKILQVSEPRALSSGKYVQDMILIENGHGNNAKEHHYRLQHYTASEREAQSHNYMGYCGCSVQIEAYLNGYTYTVNNQQRHAVNLSLKSITEI
jgi:hypothetical protein